MTSSLFAKPHGGACILLAIIVTLWLPLSPSSSSASLPFGVASAAAAAAAASSPSLSSSSSSSSSSAASIGGAGQCRYQYTPTLSTSGNILSPGYPRYRGPVTCRYEFSSRPPDGASSVIDWRIRIRFVDFELGYPYEDAKNPFDCHDVDQVAVRFGDKSSQLFAVYCGSRIPPSLMSSGNWAEVLFVSRPSMFSGRGFRFEYSFVSDFGITSGEQNRSNGCWFTFSSSRTASGTFTSPNYPGLYPRNIVCHYMFYGKPNERVHIRFTDFNIEGVPPKCGESTQSDYVELSNDRLDEPIAFASRHVSPFNVDSSTASSVVLRRSAASGPGDAGRATRGAEGGGGGGRRRRLCGDAPEVTQFRSESSVYHVAFYANEVFDQTGFSAEYEFLEASVAGPGIVAGKYSTEHKPNAAVTSSSSTVYLVMALTASSLPLLLTYSMESVEGCRYL